MNFLAPGAFFLGLMLPVIVALYLLKLRRTERIVPSNFLWRRMVRDIEANAPWQKLRLNLLLILQLLAATALIIALARPFRWSEGAGGNTAILILDSSASMTATDVIPSRIESAKERARQLVDDLPDNARLTIIEAGREARVLLSSSLDRRQAHLAINQITSSSTGSDLAVALELASAIAARQPGTDIVVLSDGNADLPNRLAVKGRLRYIPFGISGANLAINMLKLEKTAGSRELTVFAQVSNYGETAADCRVTLFGDDLLVNTVDLQDIPPGGQKNVITEGIGEGTVVVKAVLTAQDDHLLMDNLAYAVRPDTRTLPVTLVTQGNRFLKTALSLLPGVVLTEQLVSPEQVGAEPTPEQSQPGGETSARNSAELTVYDGVLPDAFPPNGSMLFIAPMRSTKYFTITGSVKNPSPRPIDLSDPFLNQVSFSAVNVLDAAQISLPAWATPVVAGDLPEGNTPLLFRGISGGRRIAVIAFDLRRSDLPLQVAFPILLANMVDWLSPGTGSSVPDLVAPGDSFSISAVGYNNTATVIRPDGAAVQVNAENNRFSFSDTTLPGVYELRLQGQDTPGNPRSSRFAVNLFSPQESAIKPADNLSGVESQGNNLGPSSFQAIREAWRAFALLGLGLLIGEWLVYQRAALARLRDILRSVAKSLPYHWRFPARNRREKE